MSRVWLGWKVDPQPPGSTDHFQLHISMSPIKHMALQTKLLSFISASFIYLFFTSKKPADGWSTSVGVCWCGIIPYHRLGRTGMLKSTRYILPYSLPVSQSIDKNAGGYDMCWKCLKWSKRVLNIGASNRLWRCYTVWSHPTTNWMCWFPRK